MDGVAAGYHNTVCARESVPRLMVILAAAAHVVRTLQNWDVSCIVSRVACLPVVMLDSFCKVLVDCSLARHDADASTELQSAEVWPSTLYIYRVSSHA